jgi:hypothetical protein
VASIARSAPWVVIALSAHLGCAAPDPAQDPANFNASLTQGRCDVCIQNAAATEEAVCASDDACRALSACVTTSDRSPAAVGACYDGNPEGRAAYDVVERGVHRAICVECASACPGEPGLASDSIDAGAASRALGGDCLVAYDAGAAPSPCAACAASQCGDPLGACAPGTDCARFLDCAAAEAVPGSCATLDPSGAAAADALAACGKTKCATVCGT